MVRGNLYTFIMAIQLCLSMPSLAIAASSNGTHTLTFSTFGIIATHAASTAHQVNGTLGQPVAGQDYTSAIYALDAGFWQGSLLPVIAGDLNNDGIVNLEDVIGGLYGLTGQGSAAVKEADVDGDGKVTPAELIHIMRQQAELVE